MNALKNLVVRVTFRIGWFFDALAVRLDRPLYLRLWTKHARRWQDRHDAQKVDEA